MVVTFKEHCGRGSVGLLLLGLHCVHCIHGFFTPTGELSSCIELHFDIILPLVRPTVEFRVQREFHEEARLIVECTKK